MSIRAGAPGAPLTHHPPAILSMKKSRMCSNFSPKVERIESPLFGGSSPERGGYLVRGMARSADPTTTREGERVTRAAAPASLRGRRVGAQRFIRNAKH